VIARRRSTAAAVIVAVGIAAAACSGGDDPVELDLTGTTEADDEPAATAAPSDTAVIETGTTEPEPEPEGDDDDEPLRQPLTGVVVDDEDDLIDRAALAVKIDNNESGARPNHSGLAVADIVFEEIIEAQDTRFAAVFHTNDSDPVGPIRSGREQDVALLEPFNEPLFAWSGGNPGVTRLIAESELTDLNASRSGEGYFRGPGRRPHNLYNTTERLWAQTPPDHPGPPPQQFEYVLPGDEFSGDSTEGLGLALRGKRVGWDWDAEAGSFARSQAGTPHVDVVHGPIMATNVVVMVVVYRQSSIDQGAPEALTAGFGQAFVFSNGRVVEGLWGREAPGEPIRLTDVDGNDLRLTPGNTWVELAENVGDPDGNGIDTNLIIR
jgi:hypothetical protein